jgi:CHAT domain-containing protein/Tfp pilus assembly protein PilF
LQILRKTTWRGSQWLFVGCLLGVVSWPGHSGILHLRCCDPINPVPSGLVFSSQDSLLLARMAAVARSPDDKKPAENAATDAQSVTLFEKLIYHGLIAKCRGETQTSRKYLKKAEVAALYFNRVCNSPFLLQLLGFYSGLQGPDLRTKLTAERFFYKGYNLLCQNQLAEAGNTLETCHQSFVQIHDVKRETDTLFHLARVAYLQEDYFRCLDLAAEALGKARAANYERRMRWSHCLIGETYQALSDYDQAQREFELTLNLAETGGDTTLLARAYERLGINFWHRGDFLNALHAVQRSQRWSHQIHDRQNEINCWIDLGMIHRRLGNYSEASQCYQQAYDLDRVLARPHLYSVILNNWAGLYLELGDLQHALELLKKALQEEKAEPNPQPHRLATRLSNIGLIYSRLNDHEKALEYQKLALQELTKDRSLNSQKAWIHLRMGDLYREVEDKEQAGRSYKTALTVSSRIKATMIQIDALLGLGHLYREQGESDQALALHKEAQQLAQQTGSPELQWNASFGLGKTFEAFNAFDQAQRAYEIALDKVETSRTKIFDDTLRMSFFASKQDVYDQLVALHLKARNDPEAALHYSERARARTMLDIMGERVDDARFIHGIPRLTDLQALMTSDVVFVEYKLLPDQLVIWVINKDSLKIAETPVAREELVRLSRDFLKSIGADSFEIFQKRFDEDPKRLVKESSQLGRLLYDHLVAPIEPHLSSQQVICLIPDGVLHYLPFAALTAPNGEFLIEKHKIGYMPSLTVYSYLARRQRHKHKPNQPPEKILAVGNPTGDLWNSEKEVKSIAALFPASKLLIRGQAAEYAVAEHLQADFDYFHFAGHCRINEKSPMYSSLLLFADSGASPMANHAGAGTNGMLDDGALTVQELSSYSLDHIELATLSACETALGRLFKGEGMMGLSQALLGSGISTLVSSLWRVDDRVSAQLMERFYQYHVTAKYTKLEALRQAQLDMIARGRRANEVSYGFPYFWSSYVLSGMFR